MRVLHICTTDKGGAAIAAIRIHIGLLENGVDSKFMSLEKSSSSIPCHVLFDGTFLNKKPTYPLLTFKNLIREKITRNYEMKVSNFKKQELEDEKYRTPQIVDGFLTFGLFSSPYSICDILESETYKEADIIHLHWVAGFIDYPSFFKNNKKPVIWTLHDANPFRGGFHHEDDELRNISTHKELDDSYKAIKKTTIDNQKQLTVVSPSTWLRNDAQQSNVFTKRKVLTIRNGIDTRIFKFQEKQWIKKYFEIPETTKVLLFASSDIQDQRKGLDLLLPLIDDKEYHDVMFLLAGDGSKQVDKDNVKSLGKVVDQRLMAFIYLVSDFFVLPSRLDNLPNTMVESLCCGTPVIGFDIGDNQEIIGVNSFGVVAEEVSIDGLHKAIQKGFATIENFNNEAISNKAHQLFNQNTQAKLYKQEYQSLLD